jgi:hypothetical protein
MLSEKRAKNILFPYHNVLQRIVTNAWEKWRASSGQFEEPYKRTATVSIHNHMADEAKREFADCPDAHLVEEHETILVSFGGLIAVCFKKLDEQLRTSNIPTQRQFEFAGQLPLEGIPDCPRVVVGYVPDRLWLEIEVFVVFSQGNRLIWSYSLAEHHTSQLKVIDKLPTQQEDSSWNFNPRVDEDTSREQSVS